jgi:hypothetical protein
MIQTAYAGETITLPNPCLTPGCPYCAANRTPFCLHCQREQQREGRGLAALTAAICILAVSFVLLAITAQCVRAFGEARDVRAHTEEIATK